MGGRPSFGTWLFMWTVLGGSVMLTNCSPANKPRQANTMADMKPKLLYIMLDGFRWDYLDKFQPGELPGFTKFLEEGVKAKWTEPLYPSLSYPTWTTLVTGQYAETHGIVGNYFYDPVAKDVFSLFDNDSTGKAKWWTSEPIWTTAERAGLKTAQYLWARCDVPIDGIQTHFCIPFSKIPGKAIFIENIMNALDKFDNGYDFVQVYTEHADNTGHNYGPDSDEIRQSILDLDDVINTLLKKLEDMALTEIVNIVIVSDHGMAYTQKGAIDRYEIDEYLDTNLVENIADKGALMNIKVDEKNVDKVMSQLETIPGVMAYTNEQIPENLHYKNGKYVHEILLKAEKDSFLMASASEKQLPPRSNFTYVGAHGYGPDVTNMRGIFFAKGPAFKRGQIINPIHVVDVYQVLTNVLDLTPNPHNGTWSKVAAAFEDVPSTSSAGALKPITLMVFMLSFIKWT